MNCRESFASITHILLVRDELRIEEVLEELDLHGRAPRCQADSDVSSAGKSARASPFRASLVHSAVSRPSSPAHFLTPARALRILCTKIDRQSKISASAPTSAPPRRKRSNGQFAGVRSSDGRGGAAHALQHARRQHGEPFDATHLHVLRRAPTGSRRRSRHVCSKVSVDVPCDWAFDRSHMRLATALCALSGSISKDTAVGA